MAVKLYSWDDVGAPQLGTTNDGSLLSILQACLVNGYGSRTSAGWLMPFSDLPNKKACFKPTAEDVYLRLDDNYSYQWAKISGFTAMSDIDTGTGEFPSVDNMVGPTYYLGCSKRYTTSTGYEKWHIIASENWFYFVSHYPAPSFSYPGGLFFGKINHVDPNWLAPYMICGQQVTNGVTTTAFPTSIFSGSYWYMNDDYGLTGIPQQVYEQYHNLGYVNPNPITGKLEFQDRFLVSPSPVIRFGVRPNINYSLGSSSITLYGSGQKIEINTVKYLTVKLGAVLILIEYDSDVG